MTVIYTVWICLKNCAKHFRRWAFSSTNDLFLLIEISYKLERQRDTKVQLMGEAIKLRQTCQFHPLATSLKISSTLHLLTLIQLVKTTCRKLADNKFRQSTSTTLLATCNRLFVKKLSQAMRTHPDIGLLITGLSQDVSWLYTPPVYPPPLRSYISMFFTIHENLW